MARSPLTREDAVALRRRVGACLGARALARTSFVWPVVVPFYARFAELSPSGAFWLVAAYVLGGLVADRPGAHLVHRFGRRSSLIAATGASAAACALVLVGAEPISFAIGQLLLGAARAVQDAALPGLLAATLADFGQDEDAPSLEDRAVSLETTVMLGSALLSGVLLESWVLAPYLFTLVAAAGALACAVLLDEPRRSARKPGRREVSMATREIARAPALARSVLFGAIAAALSLVVRFAQQPFLESVGCPLALLGALAAVAGALRVAARHWDGGALRERWLTGPMSWIAAPWLAVLGMAVVPHPAIGLLALLRGGGDGTRARDLDRVLDALVAAPYRPAAEAAIAIAARAGALVAAVLLAVLADSLGLAWALGVLALAALSSTLLVAWLPLRPAPPHEGDRVDIVVAPPRGGPVRRS